MLSLPFAPQGFEPIAGRDTHVVEPLGVVDETQLPQRNRLNLGRKSSAAPTFPDRCRLGVAKANDHYGSITHDVIRYKAERSVIITHRPYRGLVMSAQIASGTQDRDSERPALGGYADGEHNMRQRARAFEIKGVPKTIEPVHWPTACR